MFIGTWVCCVKTPVAARVVVVVVIVVVAANKGLIVCFGSQRHTANVRLNASVIGRRVEWRPAIEPHY